MRYNLDGDGVVIPDAQDTYNQFKNSVKEKVIRKLDDAIQDRVTFCDFGEISKEERFLFDELNSKGYECLEYLIDDGRTGLMIRFNPFKSEIVRSENVLLDKDTNKLQECNIELEYKDNAYEYIEKIIFKNYHELGIFLFNNYGKISVKKIIRR